MQRLDAALQEARRLVEALGSSIGRDLEDLIAKQVLKRRLDAVLLPLTCLAQAWAGAAMGGERDADDVWLRLARHVAGTGCWPDGETGLLTAGRDAVAWDLVFPDVFPAGFSVVLGNPPWDVVLPNTKDFLTGYDPAVLEAETSVERRSREATLLARPEIAAEFARYRDGFERTKRAAKRLFRHQRAAQTAGSLDLYRLFAERALQLVACDGSIGLLLPSAFHANEGSTAIRRAFFQDTNLRWCLSFENRRRVFDIDSRFKFDLIVADKPGPTGPFRCGFYLERISDVDDREKIMTFDMDFLRRSGGARLTPLELRGRVDLVVAERFFEAPDRLGDWCKARAIRFGCDLHMTHDARCFLPAGVGELTVHEGKTFHQYSDAWDTKPRYSAQPANVPPVVAAAARFYRLAFRDIARSNDERTMIAFIAPPGCVFGHTATVEKIPGGRANSDALVLCALFNSFSFDWLVRQKAATHLSLYILDGLPVPGFDALQRQFLAHAAVRLSGIHAGYEALGREQVGRWDEAIGAASLRAAIDAVVAGAYGLDRGRYRHVLGGFSHKSYPEAPVRCLDAYDELSSAGIEAFCTRHDPFPGARVVTSRARPAGGTVRDLLSA
jgi:hypothetical protein